MENKELLRQEQEAEHYINKHVIETQSQQQQFGIRGFWQEMVLNYLKDKALVYVGQALRHLAINHLTDLAAWLLEQLESYLLTLYEKGTEEEKELFKKKVLEKFPNSELAQKL